MLLFWIFQTCKQTTSRTWLTWDAVTALDSNCTWDFDCTWMTVTVLEGLNVIALEIFLLHVWETWETWNFTWYFTCINTVLVNWVVFRFPQVFPELFLNEVVQRWLNCLLLLPPCFAERLCDLNFKATLHWHWTRKTLGVQKEIYILYSYKKDPYVHARFCTDINSQHVFNTTRKQFDVYFNMFSIQIHTWKQLSKFHHRKLPSQARACLKHSAFILGH